jgi:hypothetical protein
VNARRRRILVVLHETGYFRFYGPAINELARRGWEVRIAFDRPDKRGRPSVPDHAGPDVVSLGALPEVPRRWISALRSALDYCRYLEAPFREATYLRQRSEKTLPTAFRALTKIPGLPRAVVGVLVRAMRVLERIVAADPEIARFVDAVGADVVLVSPLVTPGDSGERQTEVVKAARARRLPVIVGVASWDHLTSKGLVRIVPDALMVWNDAQVHEAVDLHRLPRSRVVVTGAQSLDHWFAPVDRLTIDACRARFAIRPGQRVILYVGSSRNMAPDESEVRFVRRWIAAVRASASAELRDAAVIVRPHPGNVDPWRDNPVPGVVVYPTSYSGIPMTDEEIETFRQSLSVSDAVVGINTTAMIEAAILERPVLTVRDDEFVHSQGETLHFGHLPIDSGGCAHVATTLDMHVVQLERVLRAPAESLEAARRFVRRFVRPLGEGQAATHHVCDVIARVAQGQTMATAVAAGTADKEFVHRGRTAS